MTYSNPIAIKENGGWRYNYGNMFYVMLVKQYLTTTKFDDKTVQGIFDEAFKYEGRHMCSEVQVQQQVLIVAD